MLDKKRPYGIITPPHNGAHYEQDGKLFNARGEPIEPPAPEPVRDIPAMPDLSNMTRDEIEAHALEHFGVDLDRRWSLDRMRARVRALHEGV